jgi:hypothetical protein
VLLLCLMVLFLGPTKVVPMLFAVGMVYLAVQRPGVFSTG